MRIKVILGVVVGMVVLVAAGLAIGYFTGGPKPATVALSDEQQELVDELGFPDTFSLAMDERDREEIWNYHSLKSSFHFLNGRYIRADNTLELLPPDAALPDVKPTDFPNGMTHDQIMADAGDELASSEALKVEDFGAIKGYQYAGGLFVGTRDDKVNFIATQPYRGGSDETSSE